MTDVIERIEPINDDIVDLHKVTTQMICRAFMLPENMLGVTKDKTYETFLACWTPDGPGDAGP